MLVSPFLIPPIQVQQVCLQARTCPPLLIPPPTALTGHTPGHQKPVLFCKDKQRLIFSLKSRPIQILSIYIDIL